jgi:hypothetical protein
MCSTPTLSSTDHRCPERVKRFFQVAQARLATTRNTTSRSSFTGPVLSTVYMEQYPSDEDAVVIAQNPIVQAAMHAGIRGRDPVYILTGLKVTKGLALELEHSSSMSAEAGASAPLTEEVSAGAEEEEEEEEIIPPGAKHLKGTALFTSQGIYTAGWNITKLRAHGLHH